MASEAVGPEPSATVRHDAAPTIARPASPVSAQANADAGFAIGYEAADPALHAPLWHEAMQAASRSRR